MLNQSICVCSVWDGDARLRKSFYERSYFCVKHKINLAVELTIQTLNYKPDHNNVAYQGLP